jgi:hypothetical protein
MKVSEAEWRRELWDAIRRGKASEIIAALDKRNSVGGDKVEKR